MAPAAAGMPLFAELIADAGVQERSRKESKLRSSLTAAEPSMRRSLLEEHLCEQIAQVLRTPTMRITRDTPFNTLGMDSLMGLELRNRLESSLGVSLQATLVWSHPTVATLAPHLAAKLDLSLADERSGAAPVPTAVEDEPAIAETPDELSETDASALLAERLAALDDEYLS
jgi:acyl carrier protein